MREPESLEPWNATKESAASRMLWLADSYAEAAMVLCNALAENDYTRHYTSTRVILHLCRHAAELFLKGAIAYKTSSEPLKTHRLDRLYSQYKTLYPDEKHQISMPFPSEVVNADSYMFPELLEEYQRTHDQRFRYPTDTNGKPFVETELFDIRAYQKAIGKFRFELNHMVARIDFGWKL